MNIQHPQPRAGSDPPASHRDAAATLFGAAHPRIVSDFGSQNFLMAPLAAAARKGQG